MTIETFSISDVDRILGLSDQFLDEWAEDAVQGGKRDPDYEQRAEEWKAVRPLLVASPALLRGLEAIIEGTRGAAPLTPEGCAALARAAIAAIHNGDSADRFGAANPFGGGPIQVESGASTQAVVPSDQPN